MKYKNTIAISEKICERHIQALWYDTAMRPANMVDDEGLPVRVIDPGEWNLGAGPDFRHAVLAIGYDQKLISGDVEIHLHPHDWDMHNHAGNKDYDNVIGHIYWYEGDKPRSLPEKTISINIRKFIENEKSFVPERIDLSSYPFLMINADIKPCYEEYGSDLQAAGQLLRECAETRITAKAAILSKRMKSDYLIKEQIIYEEIMAVLGGHENSNAFREVARMVPYERLVAEKEYALDMLLGAGEFVEWSNANTRPANRANVRLTAAAGLFSSMDVMDVVQCRDFSRENLHKVIRQFTGTGLIGRGRAAAIVANVILPLAIVEKRCKVIPQYLPPEDVSYPVRLMAMRFFGRDVNSTKAYASNGIMIQGLLQLYRQYCLKTYPKCEECPLITCRKRSDDGGMANCDIVSGNHAAG